MGWEEIAEAIVAGIIEEIGLQIFSNLFGDGKADFRATLRDALQAIADVLRKQLDEEFIRDYEADLTGLAELFEEYQNNKASAALLEHLREPVVRLTNKIASLDIQTVSAFCIIGGLNLAIHQEIYIKSRLDGDKKNIVLVAEHLVRSKPLLQEKLKQFNIARFSPIFMSTGLGHLKTASYWFLLDGDRHDVGHANIILAEHERRKIIDLEYVRFDNKIMEPAYPIFDKWVQVGNKYIS